MPTNRLYLSVRALTLLGILLLCSLAWSGAARAARFDLSGFQLSSPTYTVHEHDGHATITVIRGLGDSLESAQVGYIAIGIGHQCGSAECTAYPGADFTFTQGRLDFAPGETGRTFDVPIVDHGAATVQRTIQVSLYAPYPIGLGSVTTGVLTVLNDDPVGPANPGNPLAITPAPTSGNPLAGASYYTNPDGDAAAAARQYPALNLIARQPWVERFGSFSFGSPGQPTVGLSVSRYLIQAEEMQPGTVPLLSSYRVVDGHCGHWADRPSDVANYEDFINSLSQGIGSFRAVMFLEMDSLITSPCLTPAGVNVRMAELRYAVDTLAAQNPHLVVYLDAGAADALSAKHTASLLVRAGVARTQGFFLNSTHYDWTLKEIKYGQKVSRLIGGKHFVVSTNQNGRGPAVPRDRVHQGNEILCNPPGRGLGPLPTTHTGYPSVDAFEWILHPGESTGRCGVPGAPRTGTFWPQYALMLVHNAFLKVR